MSRTAHLDKYFECLKEKSLDSVCIQIEHANESYFLQNKNMASCVKLLKKGGILSFAFQYALQAEKRDRLCDFFHLLDLQEVDAGESKLIFAVPKEAESRVQTVTNAPVKAFGKDYFADVVKVEPEANPFSNISIGSALVDDRALLKSDVLELKAPEADCNTKKTACKNCTCGRSAYFIFKLVEFKEMMENNLKFY